MRYNATDLINNLQKRGMSKAEATRAVNNTLAGIADLLHEGREHGASLHLRGFGAFSITQHPSRTVRHLHTGEEIVTEPSRGVRFKAASALKQEVN